MGLLTFSINATLDGCVLGSGKPAKPRRCGAVAMRYERANG
jgi:hypothetical protein